MYSEVGHGTTFKLYFPESAMRVEPTPPPNTDSEPVSLIGQEAVLLVEDDQSVRMFAARVLRSHGYSVHEADSPTQALAVAESVPQPIDLLLTDVIMPGMNGCELVGQLSIRRPHMPALYMSGYTDRAVVQHGLPIDGHQLLDKPFTSSELLRKVREVLDVRITD